MSSCLPSLLSSHRRQKADTLLLDMAFDFLDGRLIHHQLLYLVRDHNQFMDSHPTTISGMTANITAPAERDRVDCLIASLKDFPLNRRCLSCVGTIFTDGFDESLCYEHHLRADTIK